MKAITVSIRVLREGCKNFKKLLDINMDVENGCMGMAVYSLMDTEQEYDEVIESLRDLADNLNSEKSTLDFRGDM
jgi:hypothetical protein